MERMSFYKAKFFITNDKDEKYYNVNASFSHNLCVYPQKLFMSFFSAFTYKCVTIAKLN